jgi:hypothetical protein
LYLVYANKNNNDHVHYTCICNDFVVSSNPDQARCTRYNIMR